MGINVDILNAFLDVFEDGAVLTIAYPNIDFNSDKPYMTVNIIPAQTQSVGVSNLDRYSGICQASIMIKGGVGAIESAEYADSILSLFTRPMSITSGTTTIKIDRTGWTSPAIQGVGGYMIPVSIPYLILN